METSRSINLNLTEGLRVMELRPCKDDILSLLGVYIVVALCEVFLLFVSEFNIFFVIGILLLDIVLCVVLVWNSIYLCRTVLLEREGCTFSFGKMSKKYNWHELKVQLCEDKNFSFYDSDISGPGILICPKLLKCGGRIPYMTFCRYRKPFSSVYIRFKSSVDEKRVIYSKVVYYGYTAEQETIMAYLKSIDIL